MGRKKKNGAGAETIASRLRALIIENPSLGGGEIKALWKEQGQKGNVTDQTISAARSYLKKLFHGDIPHHLGKFSRSGVVRQIIKANPNWTDSEIADHLGQAGILVERSLVSNTRSVAKHGPYSQRKKAKADLVGDSPDPNQNAGPRAGKGLTDGRRKKSKSERLDGYAAIEMQLERLVTEAASSIGDTGLADAIRRARRIASARLVVE